MSRNNKTDSMDRFFKKMDRDMAIGYSVIIIAAFLLSFFFGYGRGIFIGKDVAIRAIEAQGYGNIDVTDRAWFRIGINGCNMTDAVRFMAKVTNSAGKPEEVFVCTDKRLFFDGGTVRVMVIKENQ